MGKEQDVCKLCKYFQVSWRSLIKIVDREISLKDI